MWRLFPVIVLYSLFSCGGAAPTSTSGGSSPVAVELPAIVMPASLVADVSDVAVTSNVSPPAHGLKAISDASTLQTLQQIGPILSIIPEELLDNWILKKLIGMSCPAESGRTTCSFTNPDGETMEIDFASHSWPAGFSANLVGLDRPDCNRECVSDTNTATDSTKAICMRIWRNDERFMIAKMTTRPTSTDKGAGCFIAYYSPENLSFGVTYDESTATAALVTGPNTYFETFFVNLPQVLSAHIVITETGASSTSQILDFDLSALSIGSAGDDPPTEYFSYLGRWKRDEDFWYGNLYNDTNINSSSDTIESEDGVCTTKAGVRTTGCPTSITGTALPSSAPSDVVADDYTLPSTDVFPSAPTF